MTFEKGHKKSGGRQKGSTNKYSTAKTAYFNTFIHLQKVKKTSLLTWARDNLGTFYKLFGQTLPKEVQHSGLEGGAIPVKFEIVDISKKEPKKETKKK